MHPHENELMAIATVLDGHYETIRAMVDSGPATGQAAGLLEGAMEALENAAANMRAARKLMIETRGGIDRA